MRKALGVRANAWAHRGSGVLGACPAPVLRHGRYRGKRPTQGGRQEGDPAAPIAGEIVRRIDALFEIERSINGKSANERLAVRRDKSRPLVEELELYPR